MSDVRPGLAVHGAGRMGGLVAGLAREAGFDLIGLVSRHHPGERPGARWYPGLDALPTAPDVVIDFTLPAGAAAAARWCGKRGIPLVTGTTGLDGTHEAALEAAAAQAPLLQSANFSPGLNTLLALLRQTMDWLGDTVESAHVVDVHHVHKKDAPSGTALAIAEALRPLQVDIESRREGEVVGEHTVRLDLAGERLTLSHHAEDRALFARGALRAAHWLLRQAPGRYGPLDWITDERA